MRQPSIDLRPSRFDIEALLKGSSLHATIRRAVVDADGAAHNNVSGKRYIGELLGRLMEATPPWVEDPLKR